MLNQNNVLTTSTMTRQTQLIRPELAQDVANLRLLHNCWNPNETVTKKEDLPASTTNIRLFASLNH